MRNYLSNLVHSLGQSWNTFWFRPSDPYVLGLIRLLTGVVALYWYLTYLPDLERFFGPEGFVSTASAEAYRMGRGFSYFDYLETTGALWAGYIIGLIVLLLFTAGVFTSITCILAWLVMLSLVHRGPMFAISLTDVLAMLMLYLCLGPCGASFSVDSWRKRKQWTASTANSGPTALSWLATISLRLIQVHLAAAYFFMAVAKLKIDAWWAGTSIYWVSANDPNRLIDLSGLAQNLYGNYLMNAWGLSIMAFELAFAILIWNRQLRPLLLALAVPMWIGTGIVTDAYAFAALMLVANLAFFSSSGLREFFARFRKPATTVASTV